MKKVPSASVKEKFTKELGEFGLEQSFGVRYPVWIVAAVSLVLTVITLAVVLEVSGSIKISDTVQAGIIFLAGFVLGFQEWRAAREQESLEKFYDRLDNSNKRLNEWMGARLMVGPEWKDQSRFEREMYVFGELDNLEYIIVKYRLGYMLPEHALRGVKTFEARCKESKEFLVLAKDLVSGGGYNQATINLVDQIESQLTSTAEK